MATPLQKMAYPGMFPEPRATSASVTIQGNVLEYKVTDRKQAPSGGKRGNVSGFSPQARLRMLKHFQRINFDDYCEPLFLTLTYPDELALPDLSKRNIHRKVMARGLEKLTGAAIPAAWRVEWVPRQSGELVGQFCPHWHWLIFRHQFIDYREVNRLWKSTIGWDGYCRTQIERVDKCSAISMYMAKYIAKEAVSLSLVIAAYQNRIGRAYGWLRKKEIPLHPEHRRQGLSEGFRAAMMELASERLPWVSEGREQSFTLFGGVADDARRILDGEMLSE